MDPFLGSGSTLLACLNTQREGVGVELVQRWVKVAGRRLRDAKIQRRRSEAGDKKLPRALPLQIIPGDVRRVLPRLSSKSFDFIVTSPPYWRILAKARDHKSKRERLSKGLPTKYSEDGRDLGNMAEYDGFLRELGRVFAGCYRVLKEGGYIAVVVSDFRHGSRFISFHNDLAKEVELVGFSLEGITILVQDSKSLYPYGMPYAFVSNIHHQYILIFRKPPAQQAA